MDPCFQDEQNMAMVKMIADTHGRLDLCVNSVGEPSGCKVPMVKSVVGGER
jgi:hypothetical protein